MKIQNALLAYTQLSTFPSQESKEEAAENVEESEPETSRLPYAAIKRLPSTSPESSPSTPASKKKQKHK